MGGILDNDDEITQQLVVPSKKQKWQKQKLLLKGRNYAAESGS